MSGPLPFSSRVEAFCTRLTDRRIDGSLAAAKGTAELLRQLVTSSKLNTPELMLAEVKKVGLRIQAAKPIELVIGNIVRRVMHIIREEMEAEQEEQDDDLAAATSGARHVSRACVHACTCCHACGLPPGALRPCAFPTPPANVPCIPSPSRPCPALPCTPSPTPQVIDGVNDLIQELKDVEENIGAQAVEHIHANEVILVLGYSRTVLHFLRRAAEKRSFEVVVAEASPTYQGQAMAGELAALGIHATLIADSAVFAMMARVNKVLATAQALLANGGTMAPAGAHIAAMAARRHSVPFVVLCGIYKLSTLFPHNPAVNFNDFRDPADILPLTHEAPSCHHPALPMPSLQVVNPSYDYVPPELISLFVTGGCGPPRGARASSGNADELPCRAGRERQGAPASA
ncbi:hypothetical protein CHLNCDRAFT_24479 [Chlorella variabilis]|uniref:Translation initiation factor eIF2B subunit beta n=1 Tax=Chlorella variabilis TaxID=554065 RepID=E1ZHZ3_CHLVA|nr:hypothetical protein CHLNCDRAFT_24479 [Chlorella variabilis]EFN54691.1 hypothetical protein CHLNCDRAFT_24479 [Chlorella variabilis]|eukprot:XP_005846793.1 hypothetical protein CHLNCDRAFT_24479 [Chlorella variabilis]